MLDLTELNKARESAREKYQEALKKLSTSPDSLSAQLANDTYLEFKKLDNEFKNCSIVKKMEQLYGC